MPQKNSIKYNLDDPSHIFIIAEAGSNWKVGNFDDDLKRAKELIKVAVKNGADAVKFQTYHSETVYVQNAGKSKYLSDKGINKNINEIFDEYTMPYEMLDELAAYCSKQNIIFMSTPFSVQDARIIDNYVSIHKVASYEINHHRLLEFLAKTGKPVILSTGACTIDEIDFAIEILSSNKAKEFALLQCTAKYPAPLESLNLLTIPEMKNKYHVPIGFSDHSLDPIIAPVLAVGLGATIIEKHFTLNRELLGPDHSFALVPSELELMITSIRKAEAARGNGRKIILDDEFELRRFATRSIQAIKDIVKGDILQEGVNFDVLRPGNRVRGIDARFLSQVNGKKVTKNIKKGNGITEYE